MSACRGYWRAVAETEGTPARVLSDKLRVRSARVAADPRAADGRMDWSPWPAYDAAADGLRNYWYPVQWSAEVGGARSPCGWPANVVLMRDEDGAVHALHDRCPHRGVPLSLGREEFPGTLPAPTTAGPTASPTASWWR